MTDAQLLAFFHQANDNSSLYQYRFYQFVMSYILEEFQVSLTHAIVF
jgi:hypothetical protein